MCVNNTTHEIILFENINHKIIFYDLNFNLTKFKYLKEKIRIQRIVVNEKNSEIYAVNSPNKLVRFNDKNEIVEKLSVENVVNLKYFDENLYILHHLIDTTSQFISIYSVKNNNKLEFTRNILFNPFIVPDICDFYVSKNLLIFFGYYKNEWNIPNENKYLFLFNHEGLLIEKRILNLNIRNFIFLDENTMFCKIKLNDGLFNLEKITFSKEDSNYHENWFDENIPFIDED